MTLNNISSFANKAFPVGRNDATNTAVFMFKGINMGSREVSHIIVVTPADATEVIACYVASGALSKQSLFDYVDKILRRYGIWNKTATSGALPMFLIDNYLFGCANYINVELSETFNADRTPNMQPVIKVEGFTAEGEGTTSQIDVREIEK